MGRTRREAEEDESSTDHDGRDSRGAVVEANGFHDFVNELFSRRRSRRAMISAIGQQGTNLVRQLSRSSMNLLRRSQYRAANATARNAGSPGGGPQTPSSPIYEPVDYPPPPQLLPSARAIRSRSFTYSPEMINGNNRNDYLIEELLLRQQRTDSPPPTYDLCVGLPKSGNASDWSCGMGWVYKIKILTWWLNNKCIS